MAKKKEELATRSTTMIDETALYERVSEIIENRKRLAGAYANREATLMYWEVGHHIGSVVLDGERAGYGKQIVASLAQQLKGRYGSTFDYMTIQIPHNLI